MSATNGARVTVLCHIVSQTAAVQLCNSSNCGQQSYLMDGVDDMQVAVHFLSACCWHCQCIVFVFTRWHVGASCTLTDVPATSFGSWVMPRPARTNLTAMRPGNAAAKYLWCSHSVTFLSEVQLKCHCTVKACTASSLVPTGGCIMQCPS